MDEMVAHARVHVADSFGQTRLRGKLSIRLISITFESLRAFGSNRLMIEGGIKRVSFNAT